jgi:hypothetical protein
MNQNPKFRIMPLSKIGTPEATLEVFFLTDSRETSEVTKECQEPPNPNHK